MGETIIFVRQKQSLKVLNGQGSWSDALYEAHCFNSTWEAVVFCRKHSKLMAEIVVRTGPPSKDMVIDILPFN